MFSRRKYTHQEPKPRFRLALGKFLTFSTVSADSKTLYIQGGSHPSAFVAIDLTKGEVTTRTVIPNNGTLSPSGAFFVVTEPKLIRVQDSLTGQVISKIPVASPPDTVALSHDHARVVATWWKKPVTVCYDVESQKSVWSQPVSYPFLDFVPTDEAIFARKGFYLYLLNAKTGVVKGNNALFIEADDIGATNFSRDGKYLAFADLKGYAYLLKIADLYGENRHKFGPLVNAVLVLPDEKGANKQVLVAGKKTQLDTLSLDLKSEIYGWETGMKEVNEVLLTPDQKTIILIGYRSRTGRDADTVVDIWNYNDFLPKPA
jgi:WD40 repeat protein